VPWQTAVWIPPLRVRAAATRSALWRRLFRSSRTTVERLANSRSPAEKERLSRDAEKEAERSVREAEKEAERQARESEKEAARATRDAEKAAEAQVIDRTIRTLGKGLDELASGNLAFRIETGFSSDFEELRMNFNSAAAKLAEVLKNVSESSHSIKSSGGEIADASQELSKRTEHQSANLQEAASRLNEVTTTVM
jgi:methyl-accepting chemotaxis protein